MERELVTSHALVAAAPQHEDHHQFGGPVMRLWVVTRAVPLSPRWSSEVICLFIRVADHTESDAYGTMMLAGPAAMKASLVGVSVI